MSESQRRLLVDMGRNLVTGEPHGLAYPVYEVFAKRIAERSATFDPPLGPTNRVRAILAELLLEKPDPDLFIPDSRANSRS